MVRLLILLSVCCSLSWAVPRNAPIVVIGAGPAGMSALSRLIENGYTNVTLLEAENRIGGRINTVPFASNVIDLGAQWVHGNGNRGNVVWDMIDGQDLIDITPASYFIGWLMNSEGQVKPDYADIFDVCEWIYRELFACRKMCCMSFGDYFWDIFNAEMSKDKYSHISAQDKIDVVRNYEKTVNLDDASDSWFKTSVSQCAERDVDIGDLNNWKDQGYRTVFDFITKKRPDPSRNLNVEPSIQLNKEVNEVDYTDADRGFIKVKCSDGSTYQAKHVISTIPLGVLKAQHKTMFKPNLPAIKVNSIEAIGFDTLDKIALEFDKPFWPEEWSGFSMIWTPQGLAKAAKTPYDWTKSILGFYRVSYQPNVLFGWMLGEDAKLMEQLSEEDLLKGVMYVFDEFIGGSINYTTPIRVLPSRWGTNPHFQGSYSFRSLETDERNAWALDLSLPVNNNAGHPVLLFAGEATHPQYFSVVHGAVSSGYREAQRLINW